LPLAIAALMLSPFCLAKSLAKSLNTWIADSIHGEKMRKMKSKSIVCFGLFRGMELTAFGCGGTLGVISSDDPRVVDYTPVATGMYRVYFKS